MREVQALVEINDWYQEVVSMLGPLSHAATAAVKWRVWNVGGGGWTNASASIRGYSDHPVEELHFPRCTVGAQREMKGLWWTMRSSDPTNDLLIKLLRHAGQSSIHPPYVSSLNTDKVFDAALITDDPPPPPLPLLSPISFTTPPPPCSALWPPIITLLQLCCHAGEEKKRRKVWNKNCILQKTKTSWWQTQRKPTVWSAQSPELSGATRNNHGGGAGGGAWWRGGPVLYTLCSCFLSPSGKMTPSHSKERNKIDKYL